MTDLKLAKTDLLGVNAEALVLGVSQVEKSIELVTQGFDGLDSDFVSSITKLAKQLGVTGAADDVHKFLAPSGVKAKLIVLTGLGAAEKDGSFKSETLRRAAGAAVRNLSETKSVAIALPMVDEASVTAVAEGSLLGGYSFTEYKKQDKAPVTLSEIQLATDVVTPQKATAIFERASIIAEAVAATRTLTNTPPNDLYPATFAAGAIDAAKGVAGVKVTVLDDKELKAGGYVGIVGVGQGSSRGPRLVTVEYEPKNAKGSVGIVGKGITFDSGGISIKPGAGMHEMTLDMAGAAAVLHTVIAAAKLEIPVKVIGYLCLAENLPSGDAMRPGDVLRYRNGTTVEVTNTDAEGRIVMADGLIDAVEAGVDVVIDIATLTGAQMIALGSRVSGVMGTDDARDAVALAADQSGELFWPMPIPEELKADLKSTVADMTNVSGARWGGMLVAAAFLQDFVGETPWAHLDIAGPAFNPSAPWGYTVKGGTGVGVRTLLTFLQNFAVKGI
jgi:leucyl aminopeptidase